MRPLATEPDSRVGQVLTQGQWPALIAIDSSLSLLDFQPNSLLERANHCLKTGGNKWSGRDKALIKHRSICSLWNHVGNDSQSTLYCSLWQPRASVFVLIIHWCEIAWWEVTLWISFDWANSVAESRVDLKRQAAGYKWCLIGGVLFNNTSLKTLCNQVNMDTMLRAYWSTGSNGSTLPCNNNKNFTALINCAIEQNDFTISFDESQKSSTSLPPTHAELG